jgi:hypothetical protein
LQISSERKLSTFRQERRNFALINCRFANFQIPDANTAHFIYAQMQVSVYKIPYAHYNEMVDIFHKRQNLRIKDKTYALYAVRSYRLFVEIYPLALVLTTAPPLPNSQKWQKSSPTRLIILRSCGTPAPHRTAPASISPPPLVRTHSTCLALAPYVQPIGAERTFCVLLAVHGASSRSLETA